MFSRRLFIVGLVLLILGEQSVYPWEPYSSYLFGAVPSATNLLIHVTQRTCCGTTVWFGREDGDLW